MVAEDTPDAISVRLLANARRQRPQNCLNRLFCSLSTFSPSSFSLSSRRTGSATVHLTRRFVLCMMRTCRARWSVPPDSFLPFLDRRPMQQGLFFAVVAATANVVLRQTHTKQRNHFQTGLRSQLFAPFPSKALLCSLPSLFSSLTFASRPCFLVLPCRPHARRLLCWLERQAALHLWHLPVVSLGGGTIRAGEGLAATTSERACFSASQSRWLQVSSCGSTVRSFYSFLFVPN